MVLSCLFYHILSCLFYHTYILFLLILLRLLDIFSNAVYVCMRNTYISILLNTDIIIISYDMILYDDVIRIDLISPSRITSTALRPVGSAKEKRWIRQLSTTASLNSDTRSSVSTVRDFIQHDENITNGPTKLDMQPPTPRCKASVSSSSRTSKPPPS